VPETLRAILGELAERLRGLYRDRLVRLVLYGSQARGDADGTSDIDVLVVLKGTVHPGVEIDRTLDIVADISFENDQIINCVFVSERDYLQHDSPLLLNVRQEGVPI
jgi:predicted nucleotidyltransferase